MLEIFSVSPHSLLNCDKQLKSKSQTENEFLFIKIRIDQTDLFLFHLHGDFYFSWLCLRQRVLGDDTALAQPSFQVGKLTQKAPACVLKSPELGC